MVSQQLPEEWATTAATLRSARETAGLSLETLAERTRISHHHLIAIEAARFDRCGAPIYALGFARSVARTLGVPELTVAQGVKAGLAGRQPASIEPAPAPRRSALREIGVAASMFRRAPRPRS
ncbi:helix-turn-helix domain-containing protein [Sphingomonas sp. RS6]